MEIQSREIHKKALKQVCDKYGLTQKQAMKVLKLYADYNFAAINRLDPSKDLTKQVTRVIFLEVGGVRVHREFFIFNELRYGRLPKNIYNWCKIWFKYTIKLRQKAIDKFNNLNID